MTACRLYRRVRLALPALTGAVVISAVPLLPAQPAAAQVAVFDQSNLSQNILTAARTLQQVNNQIRSLQNEATMLLNQAKNLSTVAFPELDAMNQTLREIDQLMSQAQSIQFQSASTERQFRALFPGGAGQATTGRAQATAARARLEAAVSAFRQTMTVQSRIVENVRGDAVVLSEIAARSQNAEGALQVGQATNQLLALTAKQQFQIQQMMAAQYRADTLDRARRAQAEAEAQAGTVRFLGSGTAYSPR